MTLLEPTQTTTIASTSRRLILAMVAVFVALVFPAGASAWSVSTTPVDTTGSPDTRTDLATGYRFVIQNTGEGALEASLTEAHLTMPAGVGLSPTIGNDLATCTAEQFSPRQAGNPAPACPEASVVATTTIALGTAPGGLELRGRAYLGTPELGTPKGDIYPLLIAVQQAGQPTSQWTRLSGQIQIDQPGAPQGQVYAEFPLASIPIYRIEFAFRGGSSAALTTPATCGRWTRNTSRRWTAEIWTAI